MRKLYCNVYCKASNMSVFSVDGYGCIRFGNSLSYDHRPVPDTVLLKRSPGALLTACCRPSSLFFPFLNHAPPGGRLVWTLREAGTDNSSLHTVAGRRFLDSVEKFEPLVGISRGRLYNMFSGARGTD
ncbi:hypothetical protein RRG08_031265 [Elysia crispata]|uniref:Uncharacterized protein n=1 Tax=Elysia crispata TaxID=231223 RepID=A0AAE1DZE6_9GAST|nr:hypothetical protein RRG08_031265 [Elysia crispata]